MDQCPVDVDSMRAEKQKSQDEEKSFRGWGSGRDTCLRRFVQLFLL